MQSAPLQAILYQAARLQVISNTSLVQDTPTTGWVFTLDPQQSRTSPNLVKVSPLMVVKTAIGEKCYSTMTCKEVEFLGQTYVVDLIILENTSLEFILGMDWLMKNNVMIDCCSKKVIVSSEKDVKNSPYLSVLQVKKALKQGDLGYLFLGGLVGDSKKSITNILVVREFEDVFPDEIPQFLPEREI
ncbi:uncharacterized protein LOC133289118 [Gastrolobium bilobum]|uniref:uncharacterized protein LOC133289118 n=1 Tax=Gastrolobium bilobum TaxID=150636 RepID=UPI002AB326C0|nr:uncharacterized protein LOC133289118 [Gastrolobium bilobum]